MTEEIIYYLSNAVLCFIQVFFLFVNLKSKINPVVSFLIFFIPFTVVALSQKILYFVSPVILVFAAIMIYMVLVFVLFKDPARTKVFVAVVIWITVYAVTMIMTSIIKIRDGDINTPELIPNMLHNFAVAAVLTVYTLIRKKLKSKVAISSYDTVVFVLVPLSQIILMSAIAFLYNMDKITFYNSRAGFPDIDKNYIFSLVIIAVLFCVAADVVLFFLVKRISLNDKLRDELKFKDYQNRINLDYYRAMEEKSLETRKIKHDISNIIQIAFGMIENGNETNAVVSHEILSQLKESVAGIHIENFSENNLVNAIVSNKSGECRKKGIEAEFDIRIPEKLPVEELDLCKSFVNIIDNAIEAVSGLCDDKKRIEISGFVESGYLYIKSRNAVNYENKTKKTAKEDRGYGHKILSDTAEKYSGAFIVREKDGEYIALMTMKI